MNDQGSMTKSQKPIPGRLVGRKLWVFRVLMAFAVPLSVLLLAESGLRILGFGYSTSFFVPSYEFPGKWKENPAFSWRFFPKSMARAPLPLLLAKEKAPSTLRILVLGESAARGEPEPAFSFARILEVLLRDQFPDRKCEIVNTGVTAINSHAILPIARDAAPFSADYWVIYMGNNEFMGPFGPGTALGARSSRLPLLRASLALKSTRLGQTMLELWNGMTAHASSASWEGLEMFVKNSLSPDDPRLEGVYRCFESNLSDILAVGRNTSAKILLCTVGVNLADGAPFASAHPSTFTPSATNGFHQDLQKAQNLLYQNQAPEALLALDQLSKMDPLYSESSFLTGRALLAAGRTSEARTWFQKACDTDALRFRADSRINALIREAAARSVGSVQLVDVEMALAKANTNGIPGDDLFLEHVHPSFQGNYEIARTLAQSIGESLPGGKSLRAWLNPQDAAGRLGLTDWHQLGYHRRAQRRAGARRACTGAARKPGQVTLPGPRQP